jgi:large subunit ribosomal protein L17
MFRNMANALFEHEEIVTTVAKAKELRPFAEKLITLARTGAIANKSAEELRSKATGLTKGSPEHAKAMSAWRAAAAPVLHTRRQLISRIGNHRIDDEEHDTVVQKLIGAIGPRYIDRPGGYTRIVKLVKRRLGDAGHTAMISLVASEAAQSESGEAKD